MINISDLAEFSGYILGAFALGYCSSYVFYIFRRVMWSVT